MQEREEISTMTEQEEQLYDSLVREYGQMIFHLAYSERNNWHDGEEIAQETFLVLAKHIHKVKDYERIDLWLLRVLNNQILHYYRNTIPEVSLEENKEYALLSGEGTPYDDDSAALLDGLPELDQMIFRYGEMGYSLREIAQITGISYIYCRVRRNRAKKKLEAEARKRNLLK